jgi:integrase/recombinase XerD
MSTALVSLSAPASLPSIFTARPEAQNADARLLQLAHPQSQYPPRLPSAVRQFSGFCAEHGIVDLGEAQPVHVATFVEAQLKQNYRLAVTP